jgi:integrator complex subunit 1
MSRLLQALDQAVQTDLSGVTEAVMDKNYMGQLVAVQHRRGAKGGERFAESLGLNLDSHKKVTLEAAANSSGVDDEIAAIGRVSRPVVPPRSTALIPPTQVKSTLLHIFDVGSPGRMTIKEKMDTFRTLQKFLTAEMVGNGPVKPMLDATVKALDQILKSDLREPFVNACVHRTSFSCGLFRLISSSLSRPNQIDSASSKLLLKVSHSLLGHLGEKPSTPLVALLKNFQKRVCKKEEPMEQEMVDVKPATPSKRGSGGKGGRKGKIEDSEETVAYNALKLSTPQEFEGQINRLVEEALKKKSTRPLVNAMSKMLLEEEKLQVAVKIEPTEGKRIKKEKQAANGSLVDVRSDVKTKAGLLVDWLESLDPELVQATPELQQKLLFSKSLIRLTDSGVRERTSQPYLLTMLTHQASWSSLRKTVDCVLKSYNSSFDATAVLDFLSACIDIPKLWHGRAKHQPKHETLQDVLGLDGRQLLVVVDYQLLEAAEVAESPQAAANVLKNRIPLLIRCLSTDRHKARAVIDYLVDKITNDDEDEDDEEDKKKGTANVPKVDHNRKDVVQELLLQIYMKIPSCLIHLTADSSYSDLLPTKVCSIGNTSVVDCISHTLLSALAATQHGRNWGMQMQEFESATRKVASCHPVLLLRNLPLIAASLKGRTEYEFSFFRSRNHMTLYNISLGVLELLKAFVFRPEYAEALDSALHCYFDMLSSYFNRRDSIYGLIDRFVTFLHDYLSQQPQRAVTLILNEGQMLPDLQRAMPNVQSLKQLVACVNFGSSSSSSSGTMGSSFIPQIKQNAAKEAGLIRASLATAVADEEVVSTLLELNGISVGKPQVLEHLVDEINTFIAHPYKNVRIQAYNLMIKYLRYTPKDSGDVINAYITCLESSDHSVATSALEKLPDISVLAQEQLSVVLQTVFCLGLYSNMNVAQYLTETINVMNMQAGY